MTRVTGLAGNTFILTESKTKGAATIGFGGKLVCSCYNWKGYRVCRRWVFDFYRRVTRIMI